MRSIQSSTWETGESVSRTKLVGRRERERKREGDNSNSKTFFYKDYYLGSVKT